LLSSISTRQSENDHAIGDPAMLTTLIVAGEIDGATRAWSEVFSKRL
jgi:hypothetical protein